MSLGLASRIFLSTICMLVFVTGTFTNIGLLIVFLRSRELRNHVSSIYIISLLLVQIMACLYEVPYYFLSIALTLPAPPQEQYRNVCRISMFITFLLASLKVLSLTVMSLDRYLAISFPFVYQRFISRTKALLCVAYIWVQSLGYTIPLLVIKDWTSYEGQCGYACGLMWKNADNFYVVLTSAMSIAIPCVIMAFTNIKVFLTARRQHLQISSERHKRFGKSSGDTRTTLRYQESHDLSQNAEIETSGFALRGNYGSIKGSCRKEQLNGDFGKQKQGEMHDCGKLGQSNQESIQTVNKKILNRTDSVTSYLETIPENGALCKNENATEVVEVEDNFKDDIRDSKLKTMLDSNNSVLVENFCSADTYTMVSNFGDSSSSLKSKNGPEETIDENGDERVEIQNNQHEDKGRASIDSHCETVSEEIGRSTGEGIDDREEKDSEVAKSTVTAEHIRETAVKEVDDSGSKKQVSNIDPQNDRKNIGTSVSEQKSSSLKDNEGKNSDESDDFKSDRQLASSDQSTDINSEEKLGSSLKKRFSISRYLEERRKRKRSLNSESSSSSQLSFHIITSTLLLVFTFFITYTPYLISRVMFTFSLGKQSEEVIVYTALLTIFGNVVNPAIILGTRRKLRLDFMKLVCRKCT
eukprot:Seg734.3 transcript_id=Seg734.3/GoldUCD/mRNA.D3Y31 product="putative G-protein coupled receptor 101" protein_id=Seg734.3/GoldUCD/D3Y31